MKWVWLGAFCALLLAATLLAAGCRRAEKPSAKPQAGRVPTDSLRPPTRSVPAVNPFDESFLREQQARAEAVRSEYEQLRRAGGRDMNRARQVLLKRKGEILVAQKAIRSSELLSASERDSLLKPLQAESIELSERLVAVSP
jgi:hypothetical protein